MQSVLVMVQAKRELHTTRTNAKIDDVVFYQTEGLAAGHTWGEGLRNVPGETCNAFKTGFWLPENLSCGRFVN